MHHNIKKSATFIFILFTFTTVFAQNDFRRWQPENGVPVRLSLHTEWNPNGVRRNEGELVGEVGYVWTDARSGYRGIVLQVIDPEGEMKFPDEGLQVLDLTSSVDVPMIGASSDGGWYLFWSDRRNNWEGDLYCTKVTEDSEAVWGADEGGLLILEDEREYLCEKIIDDGEGGCFIFIKRTFTHIIDRFVHHITADGRPDPDWSEEGMPLQWDDAISDGDGGIIYSWTGGSRQASYDIQLQRVSAAGELLWGDDQGIIACDNNSHQRWSKLCTDGAGGVIVVWVDSRNTEETGNDIYAQRINPDGELIWGEEGAPVCIADGDQRKLNIITMGQGQSVLCWSEFAENSVILGIYAMRISGEDELSLDWDSEGGVPAMTTDYEIQDLLCEPKLCPDNEGGVYIVWSYRRDYDENRDDVFAQRINNDGETVWEENGILIQGGEYFQGFPVVNQLGGNRCSVVWSDESDQIEKVRMQYIDLDGEFEWDGEGMEFITGFDEGISEQIIVGFGEGNFAAAWIEQIKGVHSARPYVQFGHDAGDSVFFEFEDDGIAAVEGDVMGSEHLSGIQDGDGGVIIVWGDNPDGYTWSNILAQRISCEGELLWAPEGIMVSDYEYDQDDPVICTDGNEGVIVAWVVSADDIYAQRINAEGERLWGEIGERITSSEPEEKDVQIAGDGEGGAVIVWRLQTEDRNMQLRAQRLDAEGNPLWGDEPIILCSSQERQRDPQVVWHPEGFFFVWDDRRVQDQDGIYGQFIEADGELRWDDNGTMICGSIEFQHSPKTVVDSDGFIWVLWECTNDIIMQKIDPSGGAPELLFGEDGRPVIDFESLQEDFDVKTDHNGGLWVVWKDYRSMRGYDIYGIHFNPDGEFYESWSEGGNPICETGLNKITAMAAILTEGGESGIVVSWLDARGSGKNGYYDLYCQRVDDEHLSVPGSRESKTTQPSDYTIDSIYPNPFNSQTMISYTAKSDGKVKIALYDVTGRLVRQLANKKVVAGSHQLTLHAETLAAGQYIVRLDAGDTKLERKIVLLK
ncbi:T9SS type A sorting domain-containing protein [bacterium]|nr:T9SS type A sorting domain-containing protein [bacterium]